MFIDFGSIILAPRKIKRVVKRHLTAINITPLNSLEFTKKGRILDQYNTPSSSQSPDVTYCCYSSSLGHQTIFITDYPY
jgi:hypothetical protein